MFQSRKKWKRGDLGGKERNPMISLDTDAAVQSLTGDVDRCTLVSLG